MYLPLYVFVNINAIIFVIIKFSCLNIKIINIKRTKLVLHFDFVGGCCANPINLGEFFIKQFVIVVRLIGGLIGRLVKLTSVNVSFKE